MVDCAKIDQQMYIPKLLPRFEPEIEPAKTSKKGRS